MKLGRRRLAVGTVVGTVVMTVVVAARVFSNKTSSPTDPAATSGSNGAPTSTLAGTLTSDAKTGIELVFVRGGRFEMGSPVGEPERQDGELQHSVIVSDFWLGKTEVTNEQYARYLKDNPGAAEPANWTDPNSNRLHHPVVGVSWVEAQAYATWAGLRLPTEAEWEYAARAGTKTAYSSGDNETDLQAVAWYDGNSGYRPQAVAQKSPNGFGLYDLHGGVWEWCSDWYGVYGGGAQDPKGPQSGSKRVARGGSWDDPASFARSAHRVGYEPTGRWRQLGFRVARSADSRK